VTKNLEQLGFLVAEETEHCERHLGLMRRQQEFLSQGDTSSIEANAREQETALRRSRHLERRRRRLVGTLARDGGLNFGTPDLGLIIATVFDDYDHRLSAVRATMKKSIERLNKTKEQDRMLIERSLNQINEFIIQKRRVICQPY